MYNVFEKVINTGKFDLNELVEKVNRYHVEGKITEEQRDTLLTQARGYANPNYSFSSAWQEEVTRLWAEVRAMKEQIALLEPVVEPDPEAPVVDEYPAYVQPTGAHDAYPLGAKVTFDGKKYISKVAANIWTPTAYPQGWELVP